MINYNTKFLKAVTESHQKLLSKAAVESYEYDRHSIEVFYSSDL